MTHLTDENFGGGTNRDRAGQREAAGCADARLADRLALLLRANSEQLELVDAVLAGRLPASQEAPGSQAPEVETFINKKEAARRLGVQPRTVDEYMARGRIPFYRMSGRAVRLKWSEIERHVQATCRVQARGEAVGQ